MKKGKLRSGKGSFLKAAIVVSMLATWISIPFISNKVSADSLSDIRINATLSGAAINGVVPWGDAEHRLDDNGRRRLRVEGFPINLPAGTVLQINVNNAAFVQTTVSEFGHFWVERDTNNGHTVPAVSAGMPVEVLNGSTVILSGVFGTVTPTPSPSGTPFPSPSPSVSPSPSPSGTPNGTPSPSPSPSGTPNGTPSPSPSPSGTPTGTPSPSPSPSGTPTGTPSPSPSPSASPSPSPGNSGDLFAGLSGPTLNGVVPTGFGEYEIHSSRVELEVRVRQINLPAGTSLGVVVDGTLAGNMTLESDREARLRLRSDNGQTVPNVVSGSTIEVRNGGTAILAGTFMGFTATPSPSPSPSPTGTPGGTPSPTPSPSPSFGRFFESHLNGNGVTPPVTTAATGELKVQLSVDETQATVFGEFHNLSSNQTGARIETGIGTPITIRDLGVVGGVNGNFATATFAVSPAQVQMLRAGLWTAVITSVNNPDGEIRGMFRQQSNESDFNGDGNHDLAVFRPATASWYIQNPAGFTALEFGQTNDRIVSGDYDGDGRADAAVYRDVAGQGVWEIKRSSDGGVTTVQFGLASDTPVRGDFDGDGRLDLAVFRSSNGTWYIQKSNGTGYIVTQFGISSDKPMVSDMDGDGRDDIAVFRAAEGNWFWLRSSDGQFAGRQWGANGDVPMAGDFDGDGKTDITVYRPSNGIWYTYLSTTGGYRATQFGLANDIPVAGHYDGDGMTDIAVFRPSSGTWYILRSADSSFQSVQFGLAGDIPLIVRP